MKLRDWLVLVVYELQELELLFGPSPQRLPSSTAEPRDLDLPHDAKLDTQYAFTGRDGVTSYRGININHRVVERWISPRLNLEQTYLAPVSERIGAAMGIGGNSPLASIITTITDG